MYESIGKMVEYSCVLSEQRRKSHVENPTNNFNILGPQNPLILVFVDPTEYEALKSGNVWSIRTCPTDLFAKVCFGYVGQIREMFRLKQSQVRT